MRHVITAVVLFISLFAGNMANGQDVVLVGGWGASAQEVRAAGEAIGANITIPLPSSFFEKLFVGFAADDVWAQLQKRGLDKQHPVLIGHSWGGVTLRRMLAQHPEFHPEKLILIASPVGGFPYVPQPPWLSNETARPDIPTYAMTSTADETVPASSAIALPIDSTHVAILHGSHHTTYFSDPDANHQIREWIAGTTAILVASR